MLAWWGQHENPGRAPVPATRRDGSVRDAVIVAAVRTPVGKRNGGLSGVHPVDLSALVLQALAERSGIDPAVVDDVIWGCVEPGRGADLRHRAQRGPRRGLAGVACRA